MDFPNLFALSEIYVEIVTHLLIEPVYNLK